MRTPRSSSTSWYFHPASLEMQQVPSMPLSKTAVMPERARPS